VLDIFDRSTARCHDWNRPCPYLILCEHGPAAVNLATLTPNRWNPANL
jgi:hypothetical protein